ncbi:MAG: ribosome maturation factor RimP [Sulfuricellaceae bacterium]|nr:ribosome maturation factor RimP [Sulfuricellaceae bacterium]
MELRGLLEKTILGLGYEMVDLEISNRGKLLRVFIDKVGGVLIEDCTLVSNHLSRLLAVELDYDYDRLEISSPGLDRPLRKPEDFERFSGETVTLKMRIAVNGRRNFVGVLKGMKDGQVQLDVDGDRLSFDLLNVDKARLVPKF